MSSHPLPQEAQWPAFAIFTIGHSALSIGDFIDRLRAYGIEQVADIRTIPRSRHNPQFNDSTLASSLAAEGIAYVAMPGLGGLRHPQRDSPNGGWRNKSFRGYADYMQTDEFAANVDAVIELGRGKPCALMCAEAVPWRCHRSLVADALVVRGVRVDDIIDARSLRPHKLTPFASVEGLRITYPPEQPVTDVAP